MCLLPLSGCGAAFGVETKEEAQKHAAFFEQALATQTIQIEITKVIPAGGVAKMTGGEYVIRIEEGVLTTRLPFIGSGTGVDFFSHDGLSYVFEKVALDMATGMREKNYVMQFTADMKGEPVSMDIEMSRSGFATITATSNRRSAMIYYGNVIFPDE